MSKKLLSRLLSFTLSATVALTSGVPALAYDGGGGEDLLEVEDEELLEIEDEIELEDAGADFDVEEDEEGADFLADLDSDVTVNYYSDAGANNFVSSETLSFSSSPASLNTPIALSNMPECNTAHKKYSWQKCTGESNYNLDSENNIWFLSNTVSTVKLYYTEVAIQHTVTKSGSHVLWDFVGNVVDEYDSFTATLTTDDTSAYEIDDESVVVTHNGVDVTESTYNTSTNAITIAHVAGNIAVTAAVKAVSDGELKITKTGSWSSFKYGQQTAATVTYTASQYNSDWSDYDDVSWSLYKIKDTAPAVDSGTAADPRYASTNLVPVTSMAEYGFTFTQDATHGCKLVFKTTGALKALNGNFLIKAVNTKDDTNVAVLEDNFVIEDLNLDVADTERDSDPAIINFKTAKMGYAVEDYATTTASFTEPYVMGHEATISATVNSQYGLDDLTYEWVGDKFNGNDVFTVTSDHNGVWTANNETLVIKPIAGLDDYHDTYAVKVNDDNDYDDEGEVAPNDGVWTATLYAKSKGFADKVPVLTASFKVTSNLGFTAATAHGGTAAKKLDERYPVVLANRSITLGDTIDAKYFYAGPTGPEVATSGTTVYVDEYDLGIVKVGTSFNDALITVSGGVDKITISEIGTTVFGNGITATPTPATGNATFRIAGKPSAEALGAVDTNGYIHVLLQAEDGHHKKTMVQAYRLKVVAADIAYSFANEAVKAGIADNENNIFSWYAVEGYDADEEAKSLVITNNSEGSIEITAKYQTDYANTVDLDGATKFPITGLTDGKVTVPSGASKVLTITPKSGLVKGNNNSVSTILVLTGDGIAKTALNLTFTVNQNDLEITKPAGTFVWNTSSGEYDEGDAYPLNLTIGKPFTFAIGTTASEKVKSVKWAITKIGSETDPAAIKTWLTEAGISINETTGIIVGTPKVYATNAKVYVTATPTLTSGNAVSVPCVFNVNIKGSKDEFAVTANGSAIDAADNILDLGTVSIDQIDSVSQAFAVKNVSSLDIARTDATITAVKKGGTSFDTASASTATFFKLVFDEENENLDEYIQENGFALKKDESRAITLMPSMGDDVADFQKDADYVGTYWIKVEVKDHKDTTNGKATFIAKIKVTDAPLIQTTNFDTIKVGREVKEASSTIKYGVTVAGDIKTSDFTFAWTKGSVPGLTLASNGVIYGTAEKAGEFEVTVTATNKKNSTVKGTLTHKIFVNGNATLKVSSTNVGNPAGKFVLLPGIVVGSDVNKKVETFNLKSEDDTAKTVTIKVEDAPDDRTDLAAINKSPANPYAGSTNYIGIDKTSGFSEITTTGIENFSIVTKGAVAPGVYKVKITISAANANEVVFYAIMAVVDKFAITKPSDIATKIGKEYDATLATSNDYYTEGDIEIASTGGAGAQTITWSEAGTKVTSGSSETTEYYITKDGDAGDVSAITGLKLESAMTKIDGRFSLTKVSKTGGKTYITTPTAVKKSGTYSVTLKAKVEAADVNETATTADDFSKIISLSGDIDDEIIMATGTKAFPAQEAAPVTFTISSGKSDLVTITEVGTLDVSAVGTVDGFKNGDKYITRTGFTYTPVVPTYNNASFGVPVKIKNETGVDIKATAALSTDSKFEIVNEKEHNIADDGNDSFTVRPKAKLEKGTYTDTLTISGNEFETISFKLSFTVEDASYLATISGIVDDEVVKYAEKNVPVAGKTVELDNYVVGSTKSDLILSVKNVGNSELRNVAVSEVKADGTPFAIGSSDTMLTVGVIPTSIEVGATKTFTITASKNKAGVYNTNVNLHFTEGTADNATERDFWIPVTYTVYADDIEDVKVSPETKTTITVAENYAPKNAAAEFVVKNTASGAAYTVIGGDGGYTVESTNHDFEVLPATTKDLKAGESATFKIQPVKGTMLSAGEYTTKLKVSGGNIKTAIEREVVLVVTDSAEFTVDATETGEEIEDTTIATKLYNTFAVGKAITAGGTPQNPTIGVDLDEDESADITLEFTMDSATPTEARSVLATIETPSTISSASKGITLKATEQTAAKTGLGDTYVSTGDEHDAKFFATVTFNFYAEVSFGVAHEDAVVGPEATPEIPATVYADKVADLINENVYAEDNYKADGTTEGTDKYADGIIVAVVPYGAKLGSVFNNGKLPVAVKTGGVMTAWRDGTVILSADKVILKDYEADDIDWHAHVYAGANNKDEKYVKWDWKTDEKGNLYTELHLHCTDPDCPDYAGSEIVIKDAAHMTDAEIAKIPGWEDGVPGNGALVTYEERAGKDADCEHGSRYEYPASAKYNGVTYKGSKVEDETGKPLGHQFNLKIDPDIVWTDKNEDGLMTADEVTVTRTCTRCGEPIELKVISIAEKDKVEPTCTKAGSVQYAVTYTEVTEDGQTASNVEKNYKEVTVLKAKGHAKELLAEVVDFDEETMIAAKLTLTCPDCGEVLFEKTNVQFSKNDDGSYGYKALINATGEYYNVSYTNHAHVWTGEWSWSSDYKKATLTITCTQGSKPEVKEFTVDSVETVKGAMHIYTVEKTYTWTEKGEPKTQTFTDTKQLIKSDEGEVVEDIIPVDETLGIYIEGLAEEYYFTNAPIKPVFYVIDTSEGFNYLAQGVDYTVSYKNNKKLGDTATVTVKGKGNYSGQSAVATFKIVDPMKDVEQDEVEALKGAKVTLTPATYVYNGMPQYPESITLQLKGKSAVVYKFDGSAYVSEAGDAMPAVVTFANNINKGTATVLLTGKNGTNGKATTVKKTFKIKAASLESTGFEVEAADTVWAVKGAQPAVSVTWNGASLIQGQDYTVKYANNKKVGEAAKVTVTGKGNFSKKIEKTFKVTELHLDDEMLAAISATAGKKGVKVTLLDPAGNVIPAAKYTVTVLDGETDVTKAKLEADKDYTLKIVRSAKGIELSADDEIAVTFQAGIDIKSAKVDAKSVIKTYTGEAIVLDDEDIAKIAVTYKGAALKYGEDYEIKGYANNIKKGNMTVTIAGIGKYSGVKTFKVKIAPKPIVR